MRGGAMARVRTTSDPSDPGASARATRGSRGALAEMGDSRNERRKLITRGQHGRRRLLQNGQRRKPLAIQVASVQNSYGPTGPLETASQRLEDCDTTSRSRSGSRPSSKRHRSASKIATSSNLLEVLSYERLETASQRL